MVTLLSIAVEKILKTSNVCRCDDMRYDWEDFCSCDRISDGEDHEDDCEVWYEDFDDACDACMDRTDLFGRLDKFYYDPSNKYFRHEVLEKMRRMDIPNLCVVQIVALMDQVSVGRDGKTNKKNKP